MALFYAEKRHRPAEIKRRESGPLAAAVLDLCVEFMLSHLKKNLQADLYTLCLGVVHRLLCYQKKHQIRLRFEWKSLWTSLVTICSFIVGHEAILIEKIDIFTLSSAIITNLNLFITFGDTFLPDPSSYDELYYELIRVHNTFEGLYNMGTSPAHIPSHACTRTHCRVKTSRMPLCQTRTLSCEPALTPILICRMYSFTCAARRHTRGPHGPAAEKLVGDLINIRAITNHFNPRIASWKLEHGLSALSTEEVCREVHCFYLHPTTHRTLRTVVVACRPEQTTADWVCHVQRILTVCLSLCLL